MSLKRNADEILEALEAGALKFKHALGRRMRDQAEGVRNHRRRSEQTDNDLSDRQRELTDGPIYELDVGSYRDLSDRARLHSKRDGIEHDHIPSQAALLAAARREAAPRRLSPAEEKRIVDEAVTVALRNDLHSFSRTFRNRNTAEQIRLDASDLRAAAERDYQMLRLSLVVDGGYTTSQANAVIDTLREMNGLLGR